MASSDDRRAALLLLALALAGLAVRVVSTGGGPPGAVAYDSAAAGHPTRDTVAARASRLARPLAPGERIDVDRAPADELARLPRIGPGLAGRIVADREAHGAFGSPEGLDRVPGVGPALLEAIRPHVAFSGHPRTATVSSPRDVRIALNRATAEELATLPGIGPALARAIVEDRDRLGPFARLEDLTRVRGIGARTVERLRERVQLP